MKVALYTRVSTEDQAREGFSLKIQREYLLHHVKEFIKGEVFCSLPGMEVYEDDGFSGYSMDRPAFQRLLFDARNKKFDLILVYKQDRFSRKLKDLLSVMEELESLGIGFKSATEPLDTTSSAGKFTLQMLGSCAEFERNRLAERVFPGMLEGVKKGHWQGARYTPLGYVHNKETKKLEVNPEEAKVVREIFSMYRRGKSCSQIAEHYYKLGIPSRKGGKFYNKFISNILQNKVYLGTLVWNKRRYEQKEKTKDGHGKGYKYVNNDPSKILEIPNTHEPIISQKEFDEVQRLLGRNRTNSVVRFKNNVYHLSGVLRCHECGRVFRGYMSVSNHRTRVKKEYYRCASKGVYYLKCNSVSISADDANRQVWEIVDTISQNLHVLEELGDRVKLSAVEPEGTLIEKLEEAEKLLHKNLEKQKGLYEVFSEDKINIGIYKEKAEVLRNEEKRIRAGIKATQLQILDKKNSVNVTRDTQEFLLRLKQTKTKEDSDYAVKTFMRIIFRAIYVRNKEIVKVDINEPWKMCYEEGLKCLNQLKTERKEQKKTDRESVYYWLPTAAK